MDSPMKSRICFWRLVRIMRASNRSTINERKKKKQGKFRVIFRQINRLRGKLIKRRKPVGQRTGENGLCPLQRGRTAPHGWGATKNGGKAGRRLEHRRPAPPGKGVPFQELPRGARLHQPGGRVGGGPGSPSRYLSGLGQSQNHHLDPQDRWLDGERFHPGGEGRAVAPLSRRRWCGR